MCINTAARSRISDSSASEVMNHTDLVDFQSELSQLIQDCHENVTMATEKQGSGDKEEVFCSPREPTLS